VDIALLGTAGIYDELEELENEEVDITKFHRKRVYRR
jgi:hypothetical protein